MDRKEQVRLLQKVYKDLRQELKKRGGRGVMLAEAVDGLDRVIDILSGEV